LTDIAKLEECGKYLMIYPFHVNEPLDVNNLLEHLRGVSANLDVQVIDLDRVAGRKHLYLAALNAVCAFERRTNISKTVAVEFLLYLSGQKQISDAIKIMGLDEKTKEVAVIAIGENEESIRRFVERLPSITNAMSDDALVDRWSTEKTEILLSIFGIHKKELQAMSGKKAPREETIQKLILERVALLSTIV
jgi:KEOPS complex subunit Cgi121